MADGENEIKEDFFYEQFAKKGRQIKMPQVRHLPIIVVAVLVIIFCYYFLFSAPSGFPHDKIISVPSGTSLLKASEILRDQSVIRSPRLFRILVKIFDGTSGVKAGEYLFENRQNVITVARRLTEGERGFAPIKVIIPEGSNSKDIAAILKDSIPNFNSKAFLKTASPEEGYLFPDTYTFMFDSTAESVLSAMRKEFDQKIVSVESNISAFGKPLKDVITMASILEGEGRTIDTRRRIAGILWKRLKIGMPLQVDAAFRYINGKDTSLLSLDDLKIDSPYNTYLYKGLPPTPISNPGLDAIMAAVTPIDTPYLYYLTDKNGVMHYAKTHEEHLVNKELYLR